MTGICFSGDKLSKYTCTVGLIRESIKKLHGYYSTVFNPIILLVKIDVRYSWLFLKMTYVNPIPVGPIYINEPVGEGLTSPLCKIVSIYSIGLCIFKIVQEDHCLRLSRGPQLSHSF